jgi:methylated-DNA-[protein]-cysteine S-methyltransferase
VAMISAEQEKRHRIGTLTFALERVPSPLGPMMMVTDDEERLRALNWEDGEAKMHRILRTQYGVDQVRFIVRGSPSRCRRALEAYFSGTLRAIEEVVVETGGTAFQREVWAALRRIPLGQTLSYGLLAAQIGRPKAVRAVGLANGSNPVGIVVPCHRVIGADASLTGYGGGMERKRWLLEHEGVRLAAASGKLF